MDEWASRGERDKMEGGREWDVENGHDWDTEGGEKEKARKRK